MCSEVARMSDSVRRPMEVMDSVLVQDLTVTVVRFRRLASGKSGFRE